MYETPDMHRAYIGRVSGGQIRNLLQDKQNARRVFAWNIRNYVGDSKQNKRIKSTAIESPEKFFFYNNGISAIAHKVTPDPERGRLTCQELFIINGAQTAQALNKAHIKNSAQASKAEVLFRVTEISLGRKQADKDFVDSVTRYNNTQNPVKLSDFRSNDSVQRELHKRFADIALPGGKRLLYKNKRAETEDAQREVIPMEEFTKTLHSFRLGPPDLEGGTDYLFDPDKGYCKVFGDGAQLYDALTDTQFAEMAGIWFLCRETRRKCEELKPEFLAEEEARLAKTDADKRRPAVKNALERRWIIYATVGALMRRKYLEAGKELSDDLRRLAKPAKWMDENSGPRPTIHDYARCACELLIQSYRNSMKAQGADFSHRNWTRTTEAEETAAEAPEIYMRSLKPLY